jgi:hypothetical protein
MNLLKKLVPGFIRERYLEIQSRLQKLETSVERLDPDVLKDLEASVRRLNMAIDVMLVSPEYVPAGDVGFNGQACRKKIFTDIVNAMSPDVIMETGTCLGNTTGYMRQTADRPVYSCELNARLHALARMRLAGMSDVHLELKDSRDFLRDQAGNGLAAKRVLFYLDAHWNADLPLAGEIDLICSGWKQYVVMIDDFQVPDDAGYLFDNYGADKALILEYLEPTVKKYNLAVFFPSAHSNDETGNKRGCVVLAPPGEFSEKLGWLSCLRSWPAA